MARSALPLQRIAIVTESRVWGGLEAHAVSLAQALASFGLDVTIACIGDETLALYRRTVGASVPLVRVDPPAGGSRNNPLAWRRAFRSVPAHAAILEKGTLFTGSFALDLGLRLAFGPYVAIEQLEAPALPPRTKSRHFGGLVPGIGLWWYRWKLAGYLRSLAPGCTICISEAVRDRLVRMYGFNPRSIEIVPHGVDPEFRVDEARRRSARAAWRADAETFVFGTARRLIWEKGIDVALEAFAILRRRLPGRDVRLVIAGDGPERESLERLSRSLGLESSVRFLGFHPRPWEIYPGFDSFILPSRVEALGVVALEAMACACDLIASDVGGIPELIPSGSTAAVLVPPDAPDALAGAMVAAVTRTDDERAHGRAIAREHVARNYDRRALYGQIASLVEQVRRGDRRAAPDPAYRRTPCPP